jgi:hypothetical protein
MELTDRRIENATVPKDMSCLTQPHKNTKHLLSKQVPYCIKYSNLT